MKQGHAEETIEHHTEFVYGLDCSTHNQGQVVGQFVLISNNN